MARSWADVRRSRKGLRCRTLPSCQRHQPEPMLDVRRLAAVGEMRDAVALAECELEDNPRERLGRMSADSDRRPRTRIVPIRKAHVCRKKWRRRESNPRSVPAASPFARLEYLEPAPAYGPDGDGRRWRAGDVRPGEGGSRAGLHNGALPPCLTDELPRRRRACGGSPVRRWVESWVESRSRIATLKAKSPVDAELFE
jgi:hypothetical protein